MSILKKIMGSRNDRILKNYRKILNDVNSFSDEMKKVEDTDFKVITSSLKKDYSEGKTLEDILPYVHEWIRVLEDPFWLLLKIIH